MAQQVNPISISDLMTGFRADQEASRRTTNALNGARKTAADEYENMAESQGKAGLVEADIIMLQGALVIQNDKDKKAAAAQYGADPSVAGAITAELAQNIQDKTREALTSAAAIKDKLSVGLFDNPIEHIINQLTLPKDIAIHNATVDEMQISAEALQKLQAGATNAVAITEAVKATTSQDILARLADGAKLKADVVAAQTRYQAAVQDGQFVSTIGAKNHEEYNTLLATNAAIAKVISDKIDTDFKFLQMANMKQVMEQRKLEIDKLTTDQTMTKEFQAKLDKVTATNGMQRITTLEFSQLNPVAKNAMMDLIAGPDGRIAFTPVASLDTLQQLNMPLTSAMRINTIPGLMQIVNDIKADPKWALLTAGKKQAEIDFQLNSAIRARLEAASANIPPQGGYYSPLPMTALNDEVGVTNNPIWTKGGLSELAKNPMQPVDSKQIFQITTSLVVKGELTLDQAAEAYSDFFKAVVNKRNVTNQYDRVSTKVPTDFKAPVNTGYFGGGNVIDNTNETAVKNQLLRGVMQERARLFSSAEMNLFSGEQR